MKVSSFIRVGHELVQAEVELTLSNGLPVFHFTGLPDVALKEGALRVRSALREQGFELPQAQSIYVHIKPTYLKKTSRGLDLAIAAAYLLETRQLTVPEGSEPVMYGELTLKGEVVQPDDTEEAPLSDEQTLTTGKSERALPFESTQIATLRDLVSGGDRVASKDAEISVRPQTRIVSIPKSAAEVAAVVAAGEHSLLLAGPAGSGKSTLAEVIPTLLEDPIESEFSEARKIWRANRQVLTWRPVLKPHHSITPLAMIGGGASLWPGEITRAHSGVLVMDELLEFHAEIQEALREPVESGAISLVRAGASRTYPARVLLLATTNLCACGNFVPRKSTASCRCAKQVRARILTRLTGPFVDRFAVISLTDVWEKESSVLVTDVAKQIQIAHETRRARGQIVPNSRLIPESIEDSLDDFQQAYLKNSGIRSRRRKAAVLKVARTAADLRGSERIDRQDIDLAHKLCVDTHRLLEQWRE